MSTTFGVRIPENDEIEIVPIARRIGRQKGLEVFFTNPIATLLSDDIEVVAIDNSQQGINTIGDIKEAIEEWENVNGIDFVVNPQMTINNFVMPDDQIHEFMKHGTPQPYKKFTGSIDGKKVKGFVCLNDDQIYKLEYDK